LSSSQFAKIFYMAQPPQQDLLILGEAIREARERRGLTVSELAAGARLSPTRLAALEAGQVDPAFGLLLALAETVGVRLSTIFMRAEQLARRDDAAG
jgi:transcriptional regulator with XRE-family HTH domain